jgi:hypothetical protein
VTTSRSGDGVTGADHQATDSGDVIQRRASLWQQFLHRLTIEAEGSWVARGLRPVAALAREDPRLGRLFPFQSLMSLCFSRCSDWPYTNDCPAIGAARDGTYDVSAYPYPKLSWESPRPLVGYAANPTEAVRVASAALTPPMPGVWIGTADRLDDGSPSASARDSPSGDIPGH